MVLKQQIFIQKTSLAALLNAFKDGANFTAVERHSCLLNMHLTNVLLA